MLFFYNSIRQLPGSKLMYYSKQTDQAQCYYKGMNMGKKSIVIEVMKKRLAIYGFKYADYEGYRWRFNREVDRLIQSVVIQKSYHGNDYTLEMDNGYWSGRSREITNDPNCNLDFLPFHN